MVPVVIKVGNRHILIENALYSWVNHHAGRASQVKHECFRNPAIRRILITSGHDGSMPNADQYRSMRIKTSQFSQCWSMPDQNQSNGVIDGGMEKS